MNWLIEAFNPIEFAKQKDYAERRGWTKIRWINGYTVGIPPKSPWTDGYSEHIFYIPKGQLEL